MVYDVILCLGRDVQREEQGTWLGVSRKGRFAVLTNYRTRVEAIKPDAKTRGGQGVYKVFALLTLYRAH